MKKMINKISVFATVISSFTMTGCAGTNTCGPQAVPIHTQKIVQEIVVPPPPPVVLTKYICGRCRRALPSAELCSACNSPQTEVVVVVQQPVAPTTQTQVVSAPPQAQVTPAPQSQPAPQVQWPTIQQQVIIQQEPVRSRPQAQIGYYPEYGYYQYAEGAPNMVVQPRRWIPSYEEVLQERYNNRYQIYGGYQNRVYESYGWR